MQRLVALAAVAAVASVLAMTLSSAANAGHKIRIPLASAFSGPYVDFGERLFNQGAMPAVREINAAGGINGHTLEFYKMDVRFPDTVAFLSDLRLECSKKDVPMIFGIGSTKTTIASLEILKKCKIPAFNPTSGGAWPFPDFGGWLFRYLPTPEKTLPVMFRKALPAFGVKTAAISHTNDDDFAVNNIKIVRKALADDGVKIVSDQSIKTKETNFQSQVAAARRGNPDAVVLIHQPGDAGTMLRQLRDRGVKSQVFTDIIMVGAPVRPTCSPLIA
jgi:branched-chain amino acid transport system substrate-binding protein